MKAIINHDKYNNNPIMIIIYSNNIITKQKQWKIAVTHYVACLQGVEYFVFTSLALKVYSTMSLPRLS